MAHLQKARHLGDLALQIAYSSQLRQLANQALFDLACVTANEVKVETELGVSAQELCVKREKALIEL